jgi:hypothetical protein
MTSSISTDRDNNQSFTITKAIIPNWFSSWKNLSRKETISKIFEDLSKTFACLTLVVPLCTISTDLIRAKIHQNNPGLIKTNDNPLSIPQNKTRKIALLIFIVTIVATSAFFCYHFYPILIQSYPTLITTGKSFVEKYYPSAIGGVIATASGYVFNKLGRES